MSSPVTGLLPPAPIAGIAFFASGSNFRAASLSAVNTPCFAGFWMCNMWRTPNLTVPGPALSPCNSVRTRFSSSIIAVAFSRVSILDGRLSKIADMNSIASASSSPASFRSLADISATFSGVSTADGHLANMPDMNSNASAFSSPASFRHAFDMSTSNRRKTSISIETFTVLHTTSVAIEMSRFDGSCDSASLTRLSIFLWKKSFTQFTFPSHSGGIVLLAR